MHYLINGLLSKQSILFYLCTVENQVVLFDGVCNLCHTTVQKLIQLDKKKQLKFASLQSEFGQGILKKFNLPQQAFDTFLYYKNGKLYDRSTAALQVMKDLDGVYRLGRVFFIIPKFLRDGVYNFVSTNRYKWFGKKESCWLPTPDLKARFLD